MDAAGSNEANRNVIAQANFRLSFGVLVAVTIACVHWFGQSGGGTSHGLVLGMLGGYIAYAAIARWLATRPEWLANHDLVVITAVIDPLILSAWMYFAGGSSMIFVAFYLFTTLGFGFRVGTRPMHICQMFSLAGFVLVVMASPTWQGNLLFAASHALLLVVVPLYAASLVRRINAAREAAEFDSRAKSQLLAKVSHELRTPLTGIVADAQLLEIEAPDAGTVNRARSIQRLANTLDAEIKQLLDLSRIAHGGDQHIPPAPFSLAFTATQVIGSIRSIAGPKALAVELDFDERIKLPVVGRHQELVSILTNLAGNAVKFTEQGTVTLQVQLVDASPDAYRVRFAMSDTGIGIDPAHHEQIFQPFYQVESGPARRHGGTGLGVSIASELVRHMGGQLHVDSALGRGSTFFFELELPIDASQAAESAAAAPQATACVAGKRVLVADDNATNLSLLREMLLKDGHQVTAVESGHEAILMLSANSYDVIFLDYNMDDINGAEVYQTYAYSRVQLSPTFFITADTTAMTTRLLEDLGANGVIYKPLTFEKIREAIASVFPDEARPVADPLRTRQGATVLSGVPVEYLDTTAIEELREIKDSPEFLHAVVSDGIADIHTLHQAMAEAIDHADLPGLHKHAHAMKGVALSLGAVRLAHLADRLMTMTLSNLTGSGARWHEDLDACVARSCQSLDDLRLGFATQLAVNN